MGEYYVRDLRGTLYLLFGAVALLLAIGCGNVSILLLARGTARQHELAVRSAVGASRFRIVRQLLTESLLLALIGAGLGVVLAYRALGFIVARLPEYSFPHEADFHVNLPVLLFSVGLAVVVGRALRNLSRAGVGTAGDQSCHPGRHPQNGRERTRQAHAHRTDCRADRSDLITAHGGGRGHPGIFPHDAEAAGLRSAPRDVGGHPRPRKYSQRVGGARGLFHAASRAGRGHARSGFSGHFHQRHASRATDGINLSKSWARPAAEQQEALANFVSPEYFTILHIPLVEGRLWEQSEVVRGATLAIVNQTFVRRYFPGEDILSHSVRMSRLTSQPPFRLSATGSDGWLQIIGVVGGRSRPGAEQAHSAGAVSSIHRQHVYGNTDSGADPG